MDRGFAARMRRRATIQVPPDAADSIAEMIDEAAADFRYARGLEDAADMGTWLASQGLSVDHWMDAIQRSVLEQLPLMSDANASDIDALGVPEVWIADVLTGDILHDAALSLAARYAIAATLLPDSVRAVRAPTAAAFERVVPWHALHVDADRHAECDSRFDRLSSAWDRWRAGVLTETALQTAVDHHRLEWLVLDAELSWWVSEDAAREAATCVRVDGDPMRELARDAGMPFQARTMRLDQAPRPLYDRLVASTTGDIVCPVFDRPYWLIAAISAKRIPTLADQLVRDAAERAVERTHAAPLTEQHVDWWASRP